MNLNHFLLLARPSARAVKHPTASSREGMEALRNNKKVIETLATHTSLIDRVERAAPMIASAIQWYNEGKIDEGICAFQEALLDFIRAAGLLEKRWVPTSKAGVHPDNREKVCLVPIDVHDLLLWIALQGWSWTKVQALACEIPLVIWGTSGGPRTSSSPTPATASSPILWSRTSRS